MGMSNYHSLPGTESQRVRYTAAYWLIVVVVGFHAEAVSCELARARWGGRAAESSACGRGNVVGLTSILDRGQLYLVEKTQSVLERKGGSQHMNWTELT